MKTLDATSRAGGVVALVVLCAALSGCYYVPYGYVPYGDVLAAAPQQYLFSTADTTATGVPEPDVSASTNTYIAPAVPVFVAPAYYPAAYPSYGLPAWWGPSVVSLSFGYWGGCCYGGGHYRFWGHHGYWGHGYRGGWGSHGGWGGYGYSGRGMGDGHYWGGGGGYRRSH